MNIRVYDRDHKLVAQYMDVGVGKLMEVANDMMCYRPSLQNFTYECIKGFISLETDEKLL
jgi:hypothetical protein